ncbi:DUF3710 domain-containing protein [Jongsikchunia kroppenstedtii]|uniref:DUF3710 domain-containing protein n=1 Tax=Jongsikchunia kroppenstedtii TaxID=1121721 RepID=UPI000373A431|nr:DUF3710 domain-containing protein [Jongsikchunia kroppenstedtii]
MRERFRAGKAKGRYGSGKPKEPVETTAKEIGSGQGPYDIGDLVGDTDLSNSHLDLGSVLVPVVEGGQVTVEMSADHQPQNVYLVAGAGRISVQAFAAPKSPGQWREVIGELSEALRSDGAEVSLANGHWGREVIAEVGGGLHRFIGVDGPRWMVRAVISAPADQAETLEAVGRAVLSESVVRRGDEPHPPKAPLPIVLPPVLAEQVIAAQQQQPGQPGSMTGGEMAQGAMAQEAAASVIAEGEIPSAPEPVEPAEPAPGPPPSPGSAMQQLRRQGH